MTPHSFWYQKGSAASLRLHSKADVAMSTSCIIREAQLHRPQASCPFFYFKFKFPFCLLLFFYLALNFGLASCQCSLTLIPKGLVLPSSPAGVTLKDVKYLCCPAQAAVPAPGFAGKAPLPLPPAGAQVSASTLSNPRPVVFYLHHLSPQPRDEKFPCQLPTAPGYQAAGLTLY